jgi:hypothetical protein
MTKIILTLDQASLYHEAKEPVQICDAHGKVICTLTPPLTPEYIAELKRRGASPGPWYSGTDVQKMFRFLEDAQAKEGGLNEPRLNQLLDEFERDHAKVS